MFTQRCAPGRLFYFEVSPEILHNVHKSFLVKHDWKSVNKANHFKVFSCKDNNIQSKYGKNTDQGPDAGLYRPLINQSECCILQSHVIKLIIIYYVYDLHFDWSATCK